MSTQPETKHKQRSIVSLKSFNFSDVRKNVKVVLVGDIAVGKTCLIVNYFKCEFFEEYDQKVLVYRGTKNVLQK